MSSDVMIISQVMPEQIVQHCLSDALCSHVVDVPLLVTPLHPPSLAGPGVDQHHAVNSLRVGQAMSGEDVSPHTHSDANVLNNLEVIEDLLHLLSQLLHAGILVVPSQGDCTHLLARGIDVEDRET